MYKHHYSVHDFIGSMATVALFLL